MAAIAALTGGCASNEPPTNAGGAAAADPLIHEYQLGSLRVQKDKHVTTEEERRAVQVLTEQIRATAPKGSGN